MPLPLGARYFEKCVSPLCMEFAWCIAGSHKCTKTNFRILTGCLLALSQGRVRFLLQDLGNNGSLLEMPEHCGEEGADGQRG